MLDDAVASSSERHLTYVGGTAFDNLTMTDAVSRILEMARQTDRARYVCTGNLDHLALLYEDAEFRRIYAEADMVLADGMPVIWLSGFQSRAADTTGNRAGQPNTKEPLRERVAGSDLFWEIAAASAKYGLRLFYLGGADGAAEEAARVMGEQYPGAQIVGTYCPPYEAFATDEEQSEIRARIREARPHILLVGLGAPKQEKWIYQHRHALGVPVSIGVGGTFEMAAGRVHRAPRWMQRSGLEWVFRLGQEPRRLWKRYLFRDIPFFFRLLTQSGGNAGKLGRHEEGEVSMPSLPASQNSSDGPHSIPNRPSSHNGSEMVVGSPSDVSEPAASADKTTKTAVSERIR